MLFPLQLRASEAPDIVWEQLGHDDWVGALAFFPDGSRLVTGGRDTLIQIWNASDGTHQRTLAGHTDDIYAVAVSPDGKLIASGSYDRTVRIWNEEGNVIRTINLDQVVSSVAFSPDGELLLIGGGQGQIRRTNDWALVRTLGNTAGAAVFSPDGLWLAYSNSIWRSSDGLFHYALPTESLCCGDPSFSPDSSLLAYASGNPKVVRTFSVRAGAVVGTFDFPPRGLDTNPIWWIDSITFSPDGRLLGAISGSSRSFDPGPFVYIAFWNLSDGTLMKYYQDTMGRPNYGDLPIVFSLDGQFFAYTRGEGSIVVARTPGDRPRLRLVTDPEHVILSWPASVDGFILEKTQELSAPVWETVNVSPTIVGGQRVVTLNIESGMTFFHLKKQ